MWSIPGPAARTPTRRRSARAAPARRRVTLKSPASTTMSSGAPSSREPRGAQQLRLGEPAVGRVARAVQVRDQAGRPSSARGAPPGRSAAPSPTRAARRARARARAPAPRESGAGSASSVARGEHAQPRTRPGSRSPGRRTPTAAARGAARSARGRARPDRQRARARPGRDVAGREAAERPGRHLLHAEHVGVVGGREPRPSRPGMPAAAAGRVLPWKRFQLRTSTRLRYFGARPARRSARVHAVVRPRARGGARARGRRRRARDVALPLRRVAGAGRLPAQRALLSALVAALPALAAAPAAEGGRAPRGDALARRARAPTSCTCSGSRCRRPTCACASARRPSSPRTTCCRAAPPRARDLWRRLLARFDRVVVHSERGRETLAELGVDARVIPHPVYPSAATRSGRRPRRCSRSA